jgi:hypothetical protein
MCQVALEKAHKSELVLKSCLSSCEDSLYYNYYTGNDLYTHPHSFCNHSRAILHTSPVNTRKMICHLSSSRSASTHRDREKSISHFKSGLTPRRSCS